jgi:hypothetical protein
MEQVDALSTHFLNFALQYTIRNVQGNKKDKWELNVNYQLLVYDDGILLSKT